MALYVGDGVGPRLPEEKSSRLLSLLLAGEAMVYLSIDGSSVDIV